MDQSVGYSIFWLMILCSGNTFIHKCWLYTYFSNFLLNHCSSFHFWASTNCKFTEKTYYFRDELTVLKCLAATVQRVSISSIFNRNLYTNIIKEVLLYTIVRSAAGIIFIYFKMIWQSFDFNLIKFMHDQKWSLFHIDNSSTLDTLDLHSPWYSLFVLMRHKAITNQSLDLQNLLFQTFVKYWFNFTLFECFYWCTL